MILDPLAALTLPGPVLVRRDVPRDAPSGGAYAGFCVEVAELPMWIDLYVWPSATAVVPADATVLIGDIPAPGPSDRGFVELINAYSDLGAAAVPDDDAGLLLRVCVAGKYLARGDHASLGRVNGTGPCRSASWLLQPPRCGRWRTALSTYQVGHIGS